MEQMIVCPSCHADIKLDEALIGPLKEKMTEDFQKGIKEKEKKIAELAGKLDSVKKDNELSTIYM